MAFRDGKGWSKWWADWWAHKDRRRAERFAVGLMNDTKWREVWGMITEMRLRIHCASTDYGEQEGWNPGRLVGPFRTSDLQSKGIADGDLGPFRYSQVLWVRVPRIPGNDTDGFVERLKALGQLPLLLAPSYVEIGGYEEAAGAVQPAVAAAGASRRR
jgi:hypothetical protein